MAAECIAAAAILAVGDRLRAPIGPLLRHAVLLSLEAALLAVGTRPEDVARPALDGGSEALLDRCLAVPEFGLDAAQIGVIRALAAGHGAPPPAAAVAAAEAVHRAARRMVGLWPGDPLQDRPRPTG